MVRIWLPFLAAALTLLYFLAVHIPSIQRETLLKFQNEKLETVAGTIKGVLEYSLSTDQFDAIPAVLGEVPDMEMVERVGILLVEDDSLEISYLPNYGVQEGVPRLQSLLREDVTVKEMANIVDWSDPLPSTVDGLSLIHI